MSFALRVGTALGLVLPAASSAQSVADGYYLGRLQAESASSVFGLALAADGARVDLISQWSLGREVRALQRTASGLTFELPDGLGRVELRGGKTLTGTLQRANGSGAELELELTPPPVVRAEELRFESDGHTLEATLGLPAGTGPHPALVSIHA